MKVTFLGLAVEVPVFLVAVTSLSERAGQTFIFWMTMLPILRAPCFIYGLFNQSRTFAGGIRYIGVSCMWMLVNWTTPSQLFYIDETGALCHAMSGLAVDILGMCFFLPMITYPDPKHKQTTYQFFVAVILYLLVPTLGLIIYLYSPTKDLRFKYTFSAIRQCPSVPRKSILTKFGNPIT